jgi:hypothetical protein
LDYNTGKKKKQDSGIIMLFPSSFLWPIHSLVI